MKNIIYIIIMLACIRPCSSQVILQGKIVYARKMNVHRQFDDLGDENSNFKDAWLARIPKYDTRYFSFFFNAGQSKYAAIKQEESAEFNMMGGLPGTETQVFTDFAQQRIIASKKIYEERFLLEDSIRKATWKIMDEVRTIAGFSCRKAITKINDSVVVVAFYTDKIPVSGGPELFAGLPGMIMEIAVPRLYTTWIAQSVLVQAVPPTELTVPDKGKKTNRDNMQQEVRSATKNWGKFADKNLWWSNL